MDTICVNIFKKKLKKIIIQFRTTQALINNIYIFGYSGLIGKELVKKLSIEDRRFYRVGRNKASDIYLDLESPNLENLSEISAHDIFIFLSGISSPEECENNYEYTHLINYENSSKIIDFLVRKNVYVLFASTDVVYGHTEDVVYEDSILSPSNNYSIFKSMIEDKFLHSNFFNIMRLSYVWSYDDKFTKYVLKSSKENEIIEVFHPLKRSIIMIDDVVEFISIYANSPSNIPKIVNLAGPKCLSRVQLVEILAFKHSISYKIINPGKDFYKYRPAVINMKSYYLEDILKRDAKKLEEAL